MAGVPDKIKTWQMVQPTVFNRETKESTPGKLQKTEIPAPELKESGAVAERKDGIEFVLGPREIHFNISPELQKHVSFLS